MGFRLRFSLKPIHWQCFSKIQIWSITIIWNRYQYVSITIILNHDYDSIYWNHHISSSFISIHVAQMPQRDTVAGDATSKSWPDQHSCERKALWGFKLEISNASSPAWAQKRATHFGCTFSYYMHLYTIIWICYYHLLLNLLNLLLFAWFLLPQPQTSFASGRSGPWSSVSNMERIWKNPKKSDETRDELSLENHHAING